MKKSVNAVILTWLLFGMSAHAASITNTVMVDGREWAQPADFLGLSWAGINSICPLGTCSGTLTSATSTWDMNGWMWATIADVDGLLNYYLMNAGVATSDLLVGSDQYYEKNSTWSVAFFSDFTTTLSIISRMTYGMMSDPADACEGLKCVGGINDALGDVTRNDIASTKMPNNDGGLGGIGAWFYRAPVAEVPAPSTLMLLSLGLLSFRARRLVTASR